MNEILLLCSKYQVIEQDILDHILNIELSTLSLNEKLEYE